LDVRVERVRGEWLWFAAILALALGLRVAILATSQRYLRSDEAVVGIMAKHIVTCGARPIFLYGQAYGGGHAIVAYIAAPLFHLFGRSAILLTAITAAFSVANVVLLYLLLRRYYSPALGLAASLLYAVLAPVTYTSMLVNGATETLFLCLLGLHAFFRMFYEGRPSAVSALALGATCGLACWSMDFAAAYPVLYVVVLVAAGRSLLFHWKMLPGLAGFLAGWSPVLIYDVTHEWAHVGKMLGRGSGQWIGPRFLDAFGSLWVHDLAGFFYWEIDDFPRGIPWTSWAQYVVFAAALVWAVVRYGPRVRDMAVRGRGARAWEPSRVRPEVMPLLYIAVYLFLYCLSGFSAAGRRTPRYLLPLYPLAAVPMAAFVLDLCRKGRAWRVPGIGAAVVLVAAALYQDSRLIGPPRHHEHHVLTSGEGIRGVARFLEGKGIRYAFAPYEIQWRLVFESDERVIASCAGISPIDRYAAYDRAVLGAVARDAPYAFVFRRDFAFAELAAASGMGQITKETWAEMTAGIRFRMEPIGEEFVVFYDLSRPIVRNAGADRE